MDLEIAFLVGTWDSLVSSFGPERGVQRISTEFLRTSVKCNDVTSNYPKTISLHSCLIHYILGIALLDDKWVTMLNASCH